MSANRDTARGGDDVAHKVLNNNVVITIDDDGRERVLMGRGIGFQLSPEASIDPSKVEKVFVLAEGSRGDHARQLLGEVSYSIIEAATAAVDRAERMLGRDLGRTLPLALIDHINFIVDRQRQGMRVPATSMPQLRVLYPLEFEAAEHMAETISATLEISLPPEEAVFLTMHLLNATRDEPDGTAALLFRRVQHVVSIVESGLGVELDVASAGYARFILHIQFLLQRLVAETMLEGSDTSFFEFAKRSYPRSYAIAEDVKAYVLAATGSVLTTEELLYVVVHVERLATQGTIGEAQTPVLP